MSLQSLEVIKQRVDNHNPVLQGGRETMSDGPPDFQIQCFQEDSPLFIPP